MRQNGGAGSAGAGAGRRGMSTVTVPRKRAVKIPVAVWLGAIVLCSILIRLALGHRIVAPWIMVDELVYSELAKSFASSGQFLVRGVPSHGYGFVYPVLISPAWALFSKVPDAYTAAKAINAVLMSLSAIPAYLLARRVLSPRLSLFAAGLAVLVPSMLYTGELMTENAFYPLFLVAAWLLVLMLEEPTTLRQILLLAVCAIAFETRAQAIALFAAAATAPLILAAVERRGLRETGRRYPWLYGLLAGGAVLALLVTAALGRSPLSLLGAYRAATSSSYSVSGIAHFFLWHVAELDLYLGILPFAALLALWLAPRRPNAGARAFAAGSLALSFWLVVEVSIFASASYVNRIEERNTFYLAPLALTALLALAAQRVITRNRRVLIIAAAVSGVLPFFIPYTRFISTSAVSDTFALLPWWWAQDHFFHLQQVKWFALAAAVAAGVLFVLLPRRYALVLAVLVALYFVGTAYIVENGRHGIHKTALGSLYAGMHEAHRDWIDRLVGRNANVSVLWTDAMPSPYPVYENEFFNRSVRTVYDVDDATPPDPLPEVSASRQANGELAANGKTIEAQYVLAPDTLEISGTLLKDDGAGASLYRVNGPIVLLTNVDGLYKNDTWSGKLVTYQRVQCYGGSLAVELQGDSRLFKTPQTVVASEDGYVVGRAKVPVSGTTWLKVPLRATPQHVCEVGFTVGRTAVPAKVEPGSPDRRALGVHFLEFIPRQ
jgi:Dolichyl-phosphate-mannose-protein mannosyltransferase